MEIVGIITEYNPFHKGHLLHINKTKELFPDSIIILVLNGLFLQRGEISILTKEEKTQIALEYGVNLVIELPFVFGSQSADTFAFQSINILNTLGVKNIVFGSECNDAFTLESIAKYQLSHKNYDKSVQEFLKSGVNYPTALAKALGDYENISTPNDLLGISYIKAILKINKEIKFFPIKRSNDYHNITSNDAIISATNIRAKIKNNEDINRFIPVYPKGVTLKMPEYFSYLKYKIISEHNLSTYLTVDEGIENRLKKLITNASNLEEFIKLIKTKRYTYNKLNRMFIHILIGLTKEDNKNLELDYIKVLGFDSLGQMYLAKIKKTLSIPLYSKKTKSKLIDYELKACAIYDLITKSNTLEFEVRNKPITK